MADNTLMKDGGGNQYTLRAKDVSSGGDGSTRRSLVLSTAYPIDYGFGGCYHGSFKSGVIAAGLAANSPVFSIRNTSSSLLLILRKIKLLAWTTSSGFSAGLGEFDLFTARSFTVADSGGSAISLTGDQNQLRTTMSASAADIHVSSTGALTAGTRTLDTYPVESIMVNPPTATNTVFSSTAMSLLNKAQGEYQPTLTQNEGMVLQASVPATGVWTFAATVEWDEVPLAQF